MLVPSFGLVLTPSPGYHDLAASSGPDLRIRHGRDHTRSVHSRNRLFSKCQTRLLCIVHFPLRPYGPQAPWSYGRLIAN